MAPMTELVSPTFKQDFVLGCHSSAATDKTQHGSDKLKLLFESLAHMKLHNTDIMLRLWRP